MLHFFSTQAGKTGGLLAGSKHIPEPLRLYRPYRQQGLKRMQHPFRTEN